ncbi:MAG TPA: hypothetical protein VGL20_18070, partial [Candidatus Dormibacteraeota bacterium]
DHLAALARGGGLSVVLLPGTADRVVLTRPGPAALAVVPAPPQPPDEPLSPPAPGPAAPPAAPVAAAAPVTAPDTGPPAARPHRRALPRTALPAPAAAAPAPPVPRLLLAMTLAGLGAAALLLGRPAATAGSRGLHRFARPRTGPAPRV